VGEHAVAARNAARGQRRQVARGVGLGRAEVPGVGGRRAVEGVLALWGEARRDVRGSGRDRYGGGEVGTLPARSRFTGEGDRGELGAVRGPQVAEVRSAVGGAALVEPDAVDDAGLRGLELDAEFDAVRV